MAAFVVPHRLLAAANADDDLRSWTETLPGTVAAVAARWSLRVGEPFEPGGATAWVAPARTASGDPCVVKLLHRHVEATNEAHALRLWNGHGAVRLLDTYADDETIVLRLEQCLPGTPLAARPAPEQDDVIAGLLERLWLPPPDHHPFRSLQAMCDEWADRFERAAARQPVDIDRGLVHLGLELLRELPGTAPRDVVLTTDLHAHNVLAATREPWLVIDPKPHVGDPTYDPTQHLLNGAERLHHEADLLCRRMADRLGLDPDRLRLWLFARCVQMAPRWPELAAVAHRIAP